jgi:thiamine kinase-like enzyme
MLDRPPCLVTSFIPGRVMSADELRRPDCTDAVAHALKDFHDSGTELPSTFDSFELVERYAQVATANEAELPAQHAAAREAAAAIRKAIGRAPAHLPVPCHNDLLTANFMLGDERIQIIDWEYAGMGDRHFDLGNFAVNNDFDDAQDERLLSAYFGEPPDARRLATHKLFRVMSDFREAMWGVVQTAISELDYDFHGYAAKHFERMEKATSDPSFRTWIQDARR